MAIAAIVGLFIAFNAIFYGVTHPSKPRVVQEGQSYSDGEAVFTVTAGSVEVENVR